MKTSHHQIYKESVSSVADIEAIEAQGLPTDLPVSTYQLLKQGASINPSAPALSFFLQVENHQTPEIWSYAEFMGQVTQTANFFHSLGVAKDDVVAFVLPNLPETHFTIWGGQAAGIVAAINPLLEPTAIAELLSSANAQVLVTLAPFPGTDLWEKVSQVLSIVPSIKHLVLVNLADRVFRIRRDLQDGEELTQYKYDYLRSSIPEHLQIHDFGVEVSRQNAQHLVSGRQFNAEDFSSYFCTGGTTGTPKIAMRRHGNEVANAWSTARFMSDSVSRDKTLLCGLPLFHVNGVLVTGLLPFSQGAHVILATPQGYRGKGVIEHFWEIIEYHQINFFSGVPTLFASLLQVPLNNHDVSSLQYALCGAAPLPSEIQRIFQEKTGLKILEGYGLTEATCASTANPPQGKTRSGSIGIRLPFQKMQTVILDDSGNYRDTCKVDEIGVIAIHGPNVFAGYKNPDHNKGLWLTLEDGEKWLNTGDLGRQDAEGYFYLTGRKKELIIRGGHNIDPLSIEGPLHQHTAVLMAAAIGRPDAYAGEIPVVYVQLKPGTVATEEELLAFATTHIFERAALPKYVRIIEQMPLTGIGKIFKPALKKMEIKDVIITALKQVNIGVGEVMIQDDAKLGTVLEVALIGSYDEEAVKQLLGQFQFPFIII